MNFYFNLKLVSSMDISKADELTDKAVTLDIP